MDLETLRSVATGLVGRGWDYARRGVALAKAKGQPMIPFLFSPLGRIALSALTFLGAWAYVANHYRNQGASRVTARIEKKVAEHAKTAEAARRSVADAPADSLRDAWTRD
jgi:hypothetical protein